MLDRYDSFDRTEWAALRAATPQTLTTEDLDRLTGIIEQVDLDEVEAAYLPLSRLLNLHVQATMDLHKATSSFLGTLVPKVPYIIGIAGSVAVGKSTFARILQSLLARWPRHPRVELVTTDGFLRPNTQLEERGLMDRKGFPESYDTRALIAFLHNLKAGAEEVEVPMYSHVVYDVLDEKRRIDEKPDIVILEGLNVLQVGNQSSTFVSDYFDFSIYLDAAEPDIEAWFVERFLALRESVFKDPDSFFSNFAGLSDAEAEATAREIWENINRTNLVEHIEPTRDRATLIMRKAADHRIEHVALRKL